MPNRKFKRDQKLVRTFHMKIDRKAMEETVDENGIKVGIIRGYGSVFGNVDHYNDIIAPGAFTKTLMERPKIKMLADHNAHRPIGVIPKAEEDSYGLKCEFHVNLECQDGRDKYALAKQGAVDGLSIGFNVLADKYDPETDIRTITEIRLWEISIVTFPANEAAQITEVLTSDDDEMANIRMERVKSLVTEAQAQQQEAMHTQDFSKMEKALDACIEKIQQLKKYAGEKSSGVTTSGEADTAPADEGHAAVKEFLAELKSDPGIF